MVEHKQPDSPQKTSSDEVLQYQQDECNITKIKHEYPEAMEVPASEPLAIPRKPVK